MILVVGVRRQQRRVSAADHKLDVVLDPQATLAPRYRPY